MENISLFNAETIQNLQKLRKLFLKIAVWILIIELALGAILILTGFWDISIGKIQGTFLILALILFVSVNNFIRMEKGDKIIQSFASAGFISNIIWACLAILLLWEIVPYHYTSTKLLDWGGSRTIYHNTIFAIIMLISGYAASACFWISNVMSIRETIKLVKPLKVTAIACVSYIWIFMTIMAFINIEGQDDIVTRLYSLTALAGLAFVITALAALIISKTNGKKQQSNTFVNADGTISAAPKSEAELRAEIEEQVRREMIEQEVRAKIEAERALSEKKNQNTQN